MISIHAPQWGATVFGGGRGGVFGISIHAPQWGATHREGRRPPSPAHFNPRTPVGCDASAIILFVDSKYFNPRTPVGCDHVHRTNGEALVEFQSTHPSGVRLGSEEPYAWCRVISIHAPQWGATVKIPKPGDTITISIHAPQWGATERPRMAGRCRPISIHAPQWGATSPPPNHPTRRT